MSFCATGIKFPLCDTSEENGAFQVVPGTHHLEDYYSPDSSARNDEYNKLLLRDEFHSSVEPPPGDVFQPPRRLNLKKGDIWVQDPRAIREYRGSVARLCPLLCLTSERSWLRTDRGTPNTASASRPEIVICFASAEGRQDETEFQKGGITLEEYEALGLSERGERLLGHGKPQSAARL